MFSVVNDLGAGLGYWVGLNINSLALAPRLWHHRNRESNPQAHARRRGLVCAWSSQLRSDAPPASPPRKIDMTMGKGYRSRDSNQLANWIVDRSTDDAPEPPQGHPPQGPPQPPSDLKTYRSAIGCKGGTDWRKEARKRQNQEKLLGAVALYRIRLPAEGRR